MRHRLFLALWMLPLAALSSDLDEFKVKREEVFEFARKPEIVARFDDSLRFTFESRGYCDVTVAVEDLNGNLLRRLACGVLGPKAPSPLQSNSLVQVLTWDLTDDRGNRVNPDSAVIRVSLGLKPEYEKDVYGDPKWRLGSPGPIFAAAPEGVYCLETMGMAYLVLFSHDGEYIKTLYPFPADKLTDVQGLDWTAVPQLAQQQPWKSGGYRRQTLLNCGLTPADWMSPVATAMCISGNRIAIAKQKLVRVSTDGSTGGLELNGPDVFVDSGSAVSVMDAAFGPQGRVIYFTGLHRSPTAGDSTIFLPMVLRMEYAGASKAELFAGPASGLGLQTPVSVACDSSGRIYVADYLADRVLVLDSSGALLKSVTTARPAQVRIHPRTQALYVFSWYIRSGLTAPPSAAHLVRYGDYDHLVPVDTVAIPQADSRSGEAYAGVYYRAEIDAYADTLTFWLGRVCYWDNYSDKGTLMLVADGKTMAVKRDFSVDARKNVEIIGPTQGISPLLQVNQKTGNLYIRNTWSNGGLVEVVPATKAHRRVRLPGNGESDMYGNDFLTDMTFGADGRVYWRVGSWDPACTTYIVRSESVDSLVEAPLPNGTPCHVPYLGNVTGCYLSNGCSHTSWTAGFGVSPNGTVAVARRITGAHPGRLISGRPDMENWGMTIWDKSGNVLDTDAVPGIGRPYGLRPDDSLNIYFLHGALRKLDGADYFSAMTGTITCAHTGKARMLSPATQFPIHADSIPQRPYDIVTRGLNLWAEGVDWMYGGVGFCEVAGYDYPCNCWHGRPDFDDFGRSFAPEPDIYRVAVLDSRGNLILHVGQYGNADSRGPGSAVPLGGDEVGLFQPMALAVDTDKKLYISDMGNKRVVGVRLGYHAEERVNAGVVRLETLGLPQGDVGFMVSPNPFSGSPRIAYSLKYPAKVTLRIYDVKGVLVASMAKGLKPQGRHEFALSGRGFPSGCYLFRLEAGEGVYEKRVVILK